MRAPPFRRLFWLSVYFAAPALAAAGKGVAVLWAKPGASGRVQVDRAILDGMHAPGGSVAGEKFDCGPSGARLELTVSPTGPQGPGHLPALVTVTPAARAFTFALGDVNATCPVYLPDDGVIVTEAGDRRSFNEIVATIHARGGTTKLQQIAAAPEANFAGAAAQAREVRVQTWLGVSRDMRLFWLDETLETIRPKFAGYDVNFGEFPKQPAAYAYQLGRGWGPRETVTRRLEEGVLPILRGAVDDEAVHYDFTAFASTEKTPLTAATLRGTDYLVADAHGHGHMFTPAQAEAEKAIHEAELEPGEEIVLCARAVATNRGTAPHYALLRTVAPTLATPISPRLPDWRFDGAQGFSAFDSGRVFAVSRLNGRPLPAEELSVLLQPGESAVLEFFLPHRPVSAERAAALCRRSFEARLAEAREFWRHKLASAAQWRLPEPRVEEMVQAGLLHLDLVSYGREPGGPLLPAIGLYTAIGSESAPIIQFMDSMGWHDTAARAIDFFLRKQHEDGFIQNFNGYMLETGAVLWTMGEHWRYTRDVTWLRRVHPQLTRACDYLTAWRARNSQPELRGKGYGLLDGKTADPEDPYRSYMLNGYAYLGLARAAEMLAALAPDEAARRRATAEALKADIRTALEAALEQSPVVPLGDGTWTRAAPPWTNYRGPVMLHADGGKWFTHGSMTSRDSLLGPLYLVFQEVVAPAEPIATELLGAHSELMTRDNAAFSQPYYSRHPWVHLQRGEVKAFLQARYATLAALADRGTYTFTEHFFPVSAHKTHEEAWFLMETRWMLYLESGDTLRLLAGVPRDYLRPGTRISVEHAASYFGPLSFSVMVSADGKLVTVTVDCAGERRPRTVGIRLPHARGPAPGAASGGDYQRETESLLIRDFTGHAEAKVHFP